MSLENKYFYIKIMKYLIFVAIFLGLLSFSSQKNAFQVTDLHELGRVGDGAVSPDGEYVVYSVQTWNPKSGKTSTNLRATRIADHSNFEVTPPQEGIADTNPAFSNAFPGHLFFLSNLDGLTQLYSIEFPSHSSSKAQLLSKVPLDIDNLKISDRTIAFSAQVYHECSDFECTAQKDKEVESRGPNTYTVYDKMFVSHWDQWDMHKVSHIFVSFLHLGSDSLTMTEPMDVLVGLNTQSPVPPFGGSEQFDLSKDGTEIALTVQDRTRDEAWRTDWKVCHIKVAEKWTELERLTDGFQGRTQNPRISPNKKKIGFLAMDRKGLESDSLRLVIYSKLDGTFQKIDHEFDRSIDDFLWVNDHEILILAIDNGNTKIYSVNLEVDSPKIVLEHDDEISTSSLQRIPGTHHSFIASRSSFTKPVDFWYFDRKKMTQVTFVNSEALSKFELSEPDIFYFPGGHHDRIQGWVLKPTNFNPEKSYPIAFLIHGGPESPWFQSWSYRWNPQLWAARGYAVLMINPHGSPGQGQKFTDSVINDWGGVPYHDLMTGLDHAVKKFKWMDNERACAVGASYGGYMVNWIQGQTDRFKCLVTHDGVFSTVSMFYATDEIWFPMAEYCPLGKVGCTPWEKNAREGFEKYSPEKYVDNWKTPHLVIHGSHDYRIPISEGLSVFTALQVKNIPSRFIHFHQESHWVLRRENSIKWYQEVLGWLDAWTQNDGIKNERME